MIQYAYIYWCEKSSNLNIYFKRVSGRCKLIINLNEFTFQNKSLFALRILS